MSKINELRKRMNLSIEAFADTLECSVSLTAKLLYGNREPSKKILKKLKQKFPDIEIADFL